MMAEYDQHSSQHDPQHNEQQQQQRASTLERGRSVKLMRNGDPFYAGRAFVINQRKYPILDVFLDDASQALRANFGAVRCIYTPKNGTRLHDINELEEHRTYVASGGERFKKLHYLDISEGKRIPNRDRSPPKLPPVRRLDVEGRALKLARSENVIIYVYRNGDPLTLPAKILLVKPTLQNWESVLDEITRKVSLSNSAVLKLYAMNGELVTSAQQLEYNGMYVAAGKERFKRIDYPDPKAFSPNSSPKMSRKSYAKSDGTNTHTTATSHGSNEYPANRRPVREEYDFFSNKPQQHRRGPTKEIDLDRDDGGIYKGRLNNRERVREVEETRETKVDLPIDYREIETVEDENLYSNAGKTPRRVPPPSNSQAFANSRRQSPPTTNQVFANSRKQSPPARPMKTPPKVHDADDEVHHKPVVKNGYHQNNDHAHKNNDIPDNHHQRTPSPSKEIDDDRHDRHSPEALHRQERISSSKMTNKDDEHHAATVIQSHIRGYLTRKQIHDTKPEDTVRLTTNDQKQQHKQHEDNALAHEMHESRNIDPPQHAPQNTESHDNSLTSVANSLVQDVLSKALLENDLIAKEEMRRRNDADDDV